MSRNRKLKNTSKFLLGITFILLIHNSSLGQTKTGISMISSLNPRNNSLSYNLGVQGESIITPQIVLFYGLTKGFTGPLPYEFRQKNRMELEVPLFLKFYVLPNNSSFSLNFYSGLINRFNLESSRSLSVSSVFWEQGIEAKYKIAKNSYFFIRYPLNRTPLMGI